MNRRSAILFGVLGLLAMVIALLAPVGSAFAAAPRAILQQEVPDPADDMARIEKSGKLVVGTSANYPPFEFYNSNFDLDGFDIALMRELGKRLGVEVVFNDFAFSGLLDAVQLGQVDAAIAAISVTPDRMDEVDFTNLYYLGQDAALVNKKFEGDIRSATDLAGLKIGVERGTTYQSWAQQHVVDKGLTPQENLLAYDNASAMVRDLRNGTIDVALMGLLPARQAEVRSTDLKIGGTGYNQQQFAIAARKESSLIGALNRALGEIQTDGTFAKLVTQYLNIDAEDVTPDEEAAVVENKPAEPPPTTTVTETVVVVEQPCILGMAFVADVNLDDYNMTAPPVMALGQDFSKVWRVSNSGTCAWEPDFALAYVNGNRAEARMGGQPVLVGRRVQPGEVIDLTAYLRAPQTYGTFQGFWQMRDSAGQYFGEVVWVGIQVPDPNPPPPPPPATINPNLRADTNYVNAGQCTNIRWDVDNVSAVYFIDGGNVQGVGGHDTRTVCPYQTTTYTLRVVANGGASSDFPITINVGGGGNAPYSINFWADRTDIDRGQCTTLRWDVQNVNAVYLDNEGVPGVSSREVCPGSSHTYKLKVVKRDGGVEEREVRIHVKDSQPQQNNPKIEEFSVNTNQIRIGQCVNFNWRTRDAAGVNFYRSGMALLQAGPTQGSIQDCPDAPGNYDYTLDAYGAGNVSQTVTVQVSPVQPR